MPDGDKYYRRLSGTGRGWGTVYRLACYKSEAGFPKDKALKAIADNLRRIDRDSLEKAICVLHESFDEERWQKRGLPFSDGDNYSKLERALNISRLQGDFDLVRILEKSVKKVFLEHRKSCLTISEEQITERLGQTLSIEIMKSRFLDRVKDGIMEKHNRSFPEQVKWGKELCKEIAEPAKKFLKGFVNGKRIRKPVTRRIDKDATSNILNQSLNVL